MTESCQCRKGNKGSQLYWTIDVSWGSVPGFMTQVVHHHSISGTRKFGILSIVVDINLSANFLARLIQLELVWHNCMVWFCSLEHSFGHIYAMVAAYNNGNFDENICYLSGFMLLEFSCGQGLIITVTALSGRLTSYFQ